MGESCDFATSVELGGFQHFHFHPENGGRFPF